MNIREELKAFYDGELTPAEAAKVQSALDSDASLREELREISAISTTFRAEVSQPEAIGLEKTLSRLESKRRQRRSPWLRPLQLAGVGLSILFLFGLMFPMFGPSEAAKAETALDRSKAVAAIAKAAEQDGMDAPASAPPAAAGSVRAGIPEAPRVRSLGTNGVIPGDTTLRHKSPGGDLQLSHEGYAALPGALSKRPPSASPPQTPALSMSKQIVRTAELSERADNPAAAEAKAAEFAKGLGGYVESSQLSQAEPGAPSASVTLRVPENRFDEAMAGLRKLGKVLSENSNGQDVTAQVVDTEARLKTMRSEEGEYRTLLGKAKRIGDVMQVKDKLDEVRQNIESLDSQRRLLGTQAAFSTILATFEQREPAAVEQAKVGWLESSRTSAMASLAWVGQTVASGAVYVAVFSPIWLPAVVICWLLVRRYR